jgi:hypothetical protein
MLRRSLLCLALALPLAAALGAQTAATPARPDLGAPAALPDGAPPHLTSIERNGLRDHAYWLADDERQGRYTSSRFQLAAAKYVADHFQKLGLKPLGDKKGFLQVYPLRRVGVEPATSLQFGAQKISTHFAVLPAHDDEKVALSGKFLWCGNGTADQVPTGLDGKLPVVVLHKLPKAEGVGGDLRAVNRFRDVADKLRAGGASAGVVCLLDDQTAYGNTLNYHGLLPDHPKLRNQAGGGGAAFSIPLFVLAAVPSRLLLAHLGVEFDEEGAPKSSQTNEKASGKLSIVVKSDDKASACNVVAVLEGRSKKAEAVVFSAHHDHIGERLDGDAFNGADDNASGTAGLLEIAEAFAKGGPRPERSIVFLSVSGEELGLWGSQWYSEHPTWPLDKIVADINIDMIGRAPGEGDTIQMQITPSNQHEKYSSIVRDGVALGAKFGITFTSGDQYYERSDHFNFARKGVPVVFFCDGEHPDYHKVTDSPDKLDYAHMEAIARLAFWTGWDVAQAKERPQELGKQASW